MSPQNSRGKKLDVTKNILVVGSINCDIILNVCTFPEVNETVMGRSAAVKLGGKGLNQAVAAARAGACVEMVACVGNDQFGGAALEYLSKNAVGTTAIQRSPDAATGTAGILVNDKAENMIAVAAGANAELEPGHLAASVRQFVNIGAVVAQLEVPLDTVRAALEYARANGVLSLFNPAPASKEAVDLLPLADLVTPNESETELLTGIYPDSEQNSKRAIGKLRELGARGVVITRGAQGCDVAWEEHFFHSPPFAVDAVDSTGAGDVFNGVLAASLVQLGGALGAAALERAVRCASAAAAMSVCKPFAQDAAPFAGELATFMDEKLAESPLS